VDWFEVTKDHSSSRSVYEKYMKYQREKQIQLVMRQRRRALAPTNEGSI
jgi:hypothetical protein